MGRQIMQYMGSRDSRLVTVRRGGTLMDADHRLLAMWAAASATDRTARAACAQLPMRRAA